jgi:hypothetical protein
MSIVPNYSRRFYGFDPTILPNCAIWLDGSDSSKIITSGSNVTQWSDKSGNNRHATRTSGQNSPTYTAGTNYIQFTANSTSTIATTSGWNYFDCTGLSALGGNQGFTLFFVIRRDSNKSNSTTSASYLTGGTSINLNQRLHCGYFYSVGAPAVSDRLRLGYWSNDLDNIALTFSTNEPIKIIRFRHLSTNARSTAINGVVVQSDTPANGFLSTTYPSACIGAREPVASGNTNPNNGFNGRIYEVIGYNRGLSDNECALVESYLGWKYRILQDSAAGFGTFNPSSITNCALWLDAADTSTLFTNRAGTLPITGSGDVVRRWNNKIGTGSFAQDFTGTSNIFPVYQNGGVYIFNQNSNNTNTTTRCAMQIQNDVQGTAVNYSVIAVIDFLNIGAAANLQTIYSNMRSNTVAASRAPQFASGDSFETSTGGTIGMSVAGAFPGTGRRIVELISSGGTAGVSTANTLSYFNQGATTTTGVGTGTFVKWSIDQNPLPTIGISATNTAGTAFDNRLANGTFYELIVYTRAITNAERTQLLSYLAKKWRLNTIPNAFRPANPYLSIPTYFKTFTPLDITSCSLWLDALDGSTFTPTNPTNGTTITEWRDKSPSSAHASVGSGTLQYRTNIFDGRPCVSFDGSSYLVGNASNTGTVVTGFVVASMNNTSSNDARIVSLSQAGQSDFNSAARSSFIIRNGTAATIRSFRNGATLGSINIINATLFIATSIYNGTNHTIYSNGTAGTTVASTGNFGYTLYGIGRDPGLTSGFLNGTVLEVIIYNAALSIAEIQEVEGYLAWKWGLKSNLPAYPTHTYSGILYPSSPKFLPTDFSNCVFWVDASDIDSVVLTTTDAVATLFDKSSNGYLFANSFEFLYNRTTRKFENLTSNGVILGSFSALSFTAPFTVFWVAQRTEAFTGGFLLDGTGATNRPRIQDSGGNYVTSQVTTTVSTTTAGVFSTRFGSSPNFNVNGAFQTVTITSSTPFNSTGITIGSDYLLANSWFGNIAEIVVLTNVTDSQRIQMEGYLAWKWGYVNLLANNHPYKDIIP